LKNEYSKKINSLDYLLKKEKNSNYEIKESLKEAETTLKNREAYWKEVELAYNN
jgi:hypothetical protein